MLPLKDINPSKRKPLITYSLITINGLVFLYELLLGKNLYNFFLRFGFIPFNFTLFLKGVTDYPYFLNIITSMFIHGGWAHIIGNMWFLLIFGDNVEDTLGKINYIILYLTSGVFAVLAQYIIMPISKIPLIGASGAISGILGAYLVLFPNAQILSLIPDPFTFGLFFRIVPINAFFFLLIWFLFQFMQGIATLPYSGRIGGTAFWAHIGGFAWGVVFTILFLLYSRLTGIKRYRRS